MAGRGPAPKASLVRPTDDKRRAAEMTVLSPDGIARGPALPAGEWPDATIALYETLRRSPMAQKWLEVDWLSLHDTMLLHAAYVGGELRHAAELRLRLGQYGVTPEARLRLRLMVDDTEPVLTKLEAFRAKHPRRQ